MGMEMEFDDNALASRGRAYRLRNYMNVFKQEGVWVTSVLPITNTTIQCIRYASREMPMIARSTTSSQHSSPPAHCAANTLPIWPWIDYSIVMRSLSKRES